MPDAIIMDGITKTFGEKVAVRDMHMAVPEGALYGFIGPNGAGKTTTIRMIMSILFPDAGRLSVLGKASAVESKDRIGYLPEERGVYKKMKVGAFLNFIGKLKGAGGPGLDKKVRGWLDRVDLGDCYKKRCDELSKGMQQKVQFIAAVLHEPDLLIFDEPFSGLDPVNMRLLRDLFLEQHEAGRTVIFSTHVMHQAEQLCDHLIMINKGDKVLDASLDEIRAQYDPRTILFAPLEPSGAEAVGSVPGVESVTPMDGAFEVSLQDGVAPPEIMRQILQLTPVSKIELRRPTLEDVFIEIVTRDATQEADEASLRAELREEAAAGASV
ncbi:MAG: ATP-binding cassette domain-containing protein [Planctomycetota bacterium]|nr:ATP-binding cassette domain-containing protein [Planctomycetota bacterium]